MNPSMMQRRDFIRAAAMAAFAPGCVSIGARRDTRLRKLGTIDILIVETSPIVFKGHPWLMEYIRWKTPQKHYRTNNTGVSYLRFRDLEDKQTFTPPFGRDFHLASAFSTGDRVIVTASAHGERDSWGGSAILQTESQDLVNWTAPRRILGDPRWQVYNTSICRADGRYLMVYELGAPRDLVGTGFTMFFAESKDLATWKTIDGAVFGREFYTGGPLLRYHAGWTYLFYLEQRAVGGALEFRTRVARSRDLVSWTVSPRVALDYDADDKLIHPQAKFTPAELDEIRNAKDINVSDLDFCEFGGKLVCSYSWGDQKGHEFLALGEVDSTEREFCESFFE